MSTERKRFALVDALRGLAAVAVMFYHYSGGDLHEPLTRALSPWVTGLLAKGWLGVHVFFTLSGFVIAYSVGRVAMTPSRALRFVVRRQVRLDPPYWFSIALATVIPLAWRLHLHDGRYVPGPRLILAHVLYVYDLLWMHPINAVYWSLAIEVQFYLAFVLFLAACRRIPRAVPWLLAASALQSLRWAVGWRFPHAFFVQHWFLFALGALTAWSLDRRVGAWVPALVAVAYCVAGYRFDRLEPIAGGLVATLLLVAGRREALGRWGRSGFLQLLGAVSYGVYLLHNELGAQVRWLTGHALHVHTPRGAVELLLLAGSVSVGAAWVMRATIEAWAIRMAGKIRWERERPREAPLERPSAVVVSRS